jgi:hypothetical protein
VITAMMRFVDGRYIATAPRGFWRGQRGCHTELSTLKSELSLLQMALFGVAATLEFRKVSLTVYQTFERVVSPSKGGKSPVRADQTVSALALVRGPRGIRVLYFWAVIVL